MAGGQGESQELREAIRQRAVEKNGISLFSIIADEKIMNLEVVLVIIWLHHFSHERL